MLKEIKEQALSLRGSIVRAGIFALAWAIFPFWLFLLVALYLFFIPFSQIKSVIIPFLALIVLAALQSAGFYAAVIFGLLFWYILLIKEFYIVDRKSAYEVLLLALTYLLFREFYLKAGGGFGGGAIFCALLIAVVVSILFSSFIKSFKEDPEQSGRLLRKVTGFTAFFVIAELLLAGLFLPLDFVYQSSIVFLLSAVFMELSSGYLFSGSLSRRRVLVFASTAFVLMVLMLGSARWGL